MLQPHQAAHHHDGGRVSSSPPTPAMAAVHNTHLASPPAMPVAAHPSSSSSRPRSSSSSSSAPSVRRMVSEFVVESRIGSGSFATVWRGFHKETGQLAAIKSVSKDKIMVNKKHQENLDMEIMIMSRLTHNNIVRLYEVKETPRHKYLILEYCAGGDLSKFIRKHGAMSEKHAKAFLGQLASGLKFLRQAHLIHRDLKPQNLLLDSDSPDATLKIADFGFARYMEPNNLAATLCGSPLYMAPEILGYKEYDASVDLWSVGGILYEMVTGKPPFTGSNHIQLLNRINTTELKFPVGLELSPACTALLVGLLRRNPRERITFEQFFAHPFVAEAMHAAAEAANNKHERLRQQQERAAAAQQQQQQQQPQTNVSSPSMQPSSRQSSPPHSAVQPPQSSSPSLTARTDSILKSLQTPMSSTPPTPNTAAAMQQQAMRNAQQTSHNSNLYGSSPSQHSYMQQQQQQQPPQQQQQPHHPSSPLYPPPASPRFSPNQHPSTSPPSPSYLPSQQQQQQQQYLQNQVYKRPPQQVGFNTSQTLSAGTSTSSAAQLQPPRPISRHNTPQYLRVSGGANSGDGSTSIEREYVLIDGDANSQTALTRDQQSSPNLHQMHGTHPASVHPSSSYDLNEEEEKSRLQVLTKRAVLVAKMGDAKLLSLGGFFAHGSANEPAPPQDAQNLVAALLDELALTDDATTAVSTMAASTVQHGGAGTPPPTIQEQLASALNLYIKSLTQLECLTGDMPRILHALADKMSRVDSPAMRAAQTEWREIQVYLLDTCHAYWEKSLRVRRAIEELEPIMAAHAHTVRLAPAIAASLSRRGSTSSVTHTGSGSGSGSGSASGSEEKSASSSDLKDDTGRSPPTGVQVPSRLSMLSMQCAEKQLYDESLSLAHAGVHAEFVGDYLAAKRSYAQSAKLLDTLAQEEKATTSDRQRLADTARMVRQRMSEASDKHDKMTTHHQVHAPPIETTPTPATVASTVLAIGQHNFVSVH